MLLSVIIPSYKEAENLEIILPQIKKCLAGIDAEILVIDTSVPIDNTPQICAKNGVVYVPRSGGNNYGDAIRTGIKRATGEYSLVMDADGSHSPEYIPHFLQEMRNKGYDLIIGSRYCDEGKTDNIAILRFMSYVLNITYRYIFRLNVQDISNSLRLYKTNQLKALSLKCNNFDIVEEILIALTIYNENMKIKEVPVFFKKRLAGESKRNLYKFILSYIFTIFRLLRIKHNLKRKG